MIWPKDKNGTPLEPGKTVLTPTGHNAILIYVNCALRFCIAGLDNLKSNGSLVYCERWKPEEFEVIA